MQSIMSSLFSPDFTPRWEAAFALYAPDGLDSPYLHAEDAPRLALTNLLLSTLDAQEPTESQQNTLVLSLRDALSKVRDTPVSAFDSAELAVALRPIRALALGELVEDVCQTLYDFYRGRWAEKLSRPDQYTLQTALSVTLAALPPKSLVPYWDNLQFGDPMMCRSMSLGLEFFRENHAASSLLFGLTYCSDHSIQAAIVDCLEQVADPQSLPTLHRLRRETAFTDWTLSRHLSRAIGIIERQNTGQQARTLLRPTSELPEDTDSLLRPISEEVRREWERQTLLRSRSTPETRQDTPPV